MGIYQNIVYKRREIRLTLYLHALQYGSTFLLEDSAWVLNCLSGSSPDVTHPDGHPGYTRLARLVMVLELHGQMEEGYKVCCKYTDSNGCIW